MNNERKNRIAAIKEKGRIKKKTKGAFGNGVNKSIPSKTKKSWRS